MHRNGAIGLRPPYGNAALYQLS